MVQSAFFEGLSAVWHLDWRGRKVAEGISGIELWQNLSEERKDLDQLV